MDDRSIKNKQFAIIILLLSLVCIIGIGINFKFSDDNVVVMSNTVENLKTNAFVTSDDYGSWNFKAEWYGNSSLIEITSSGNSLLYSPTIDSLSDPVAIKITYSPDSNNDNVTVPSNAIKIYIPKEVFGLIGNVSYVVNNSNNELQIFDGSTLVGYISFGSIYNKNDLSSSLFKWNYENDELYLYNDSSISSNGTGSSLYLYYYFLPSYTSTDINYSNFNVLFSDGTSSNFSKLKSQMYVDGSIDYIVKATLPYEFDATDYWNNDWGYRKYPMEEDWEYVTIEYSYTGTINAPFNYNIVNNINFTGELLKVGINGTYYDCDLDEYLNNSDYNTITKDYVTDNKFTVSFVVRHLMTEEYFSLTSSLNNNSNDSIYLFTSTINGNWSEEPDTEAFWIYDSNSSSSNNKPELKDDEESIEATYPSGVSNKILVDLSNSDDSVGAINKLKNNESLNYSFTVEPDTNSISVSTSGNKLKAFNNYNNTNDYNNNYKLEVMTNGLLISDSYNSDSNNINYTNYVINSFVPNNDIEYDYEKKGSTYVLNSNLEYNNYSAKELYVKINDSWELVGSYKKNSEGKIDFTSVSSVSSVNDVTIDNPIVLPENVKDVKATYEGKSVGLYIGYTINVTVNSSEEIINHIDNNENTVIKLSGKTIINDSDGDIKNKGTILTELSSYSLLDYSSVKDSDEDYVTYTAEAFEKMNCSDTQCDSVLNYLNKQDDGIFYILLPKGVTYDQLNVYDSSNNIVSNVTINTVENYYDNRYLVKVLVSKDSNINKTSSYLSTGYKLVYSIDYTKENNIKYGNVLVSDIAYYGKSLADGYNDSSDLNVDNSLFSSINVKDRFNHINGEDNTYKVMFNTNSITVSTVSIIYGTYDMSVKGFLENSYSDTALVNESSTYKYKLEYTLGDRYEEISDVLFVHKLYDSNNGFNGILDNVDTSYLDDNNINYTIYYSVKDIDLEEEVDVSDNAIWTTIKPSDDIKAIAVKLNSMVYGSDNVTPVIYVNMIAPNGYMDGISSNSQSIIRLKSNGVDKTYKSNINKVNLAETTLSLSSRVLDNIDGNVINNNDLLPGTYVYEINIANSEDINYKNIEVISNLSNIVTLLNDIDSINNNYNFDNGVLKFNIDNVDKNGIKLYIPVKIDVTKLSNDNITVTNTSSISKINNNSYNGNVSKLVNYVSVPMISYTKYVDTSDTTAYSLASSPVLIRPKENYNYMIEIINKSDVKADKITVVDNVPEGVTVGNISNGGVYNSNNNTITWSNLSINSYGTLQLVYDVTVKEDIALKTVYSTKAHVTMVNPLDNNYLLVDNDTNVVSVIYQIASDIIISNSLSGSLADKNKLFTFNVILKGNSDDQGVYAINNVDGSTISSIIIDEDGNGNSTIQLKGGELFTIKLLPSCIDYTVTQVSEAGYATTIDGENKNSVSGTTSEIREIQHVFNNNYSVSTSASLNAKVSYNNGLVNNQFTVALADDNNNIIESVSNDSDGNIQFSTINYNNEIGTKTYKIYQVNDNQKQILYDSSVYTVTVTLVNDGKGNLSNNIKYYDSNNKEVSMPLFNNTYLPTGFVIGNINNSDYVNEDIEFKYIVNISNTSNRTYNVLDIDGNVIDSIVVEDNKAQYEFILRSNEQIIISDLDMGTIYSVSQLNTDYYTSTVNGLSYSVDVENNRIVTNSTIENNTTKVLFNNKYVTSGSYSPISNVTLIDKEIEVDEFSFLITDISEGSTNGYSELITNDSEGKLMFKTIKYNRPGEYKYVITQIKGDSNHIYYDSLKCYLTVILSDNGDGTMDVSYSYKYDGENKGFVNKYSFEEIFKDNDVVIDSNVSNKEELMNPNTSSFRVMVIVFVSFIAIIILFVSGKVKLRKFE